MRKYILIGISAFLALISILIVSFGLKLGYGYGAVKKATIENNELKAQLDEKNGAEYQSAQDELNKAVEEFKINYEQNNNQSIGSGVTIVDKEKMKDTLTKHAKSSSVDLVYEIKKSMELEAASREFIYCDIYCTVKGEYYDIDKFIDSIEKDFSLNFNITNFEMNNSQGGLEAKFVVKNIPIKDN